MFIVLIAMLNVVFATSSLQCEFKVGGCDIGSGEVPVFYANNHFFDGSGEVLSSNVAVSSIPNYNKPLCCYSPFGQISVRNVDESETCGSGEVDFIYYTDVDNSRIGIEKNDSMMVAGFDYNHYAKKSCMKMPANFGSLKLIVSNRDYSPLGYSCLFKASSLVNGHVSSCDATFDGANQYQYTVWGQIWENTNSLNCNADCVSITTNRIYAECAQKVDECNVPNIAFCNGALLGTWVHYNATHEIKCQKYFDVFRPKVFTDDVLDVSSVEGYCENIVSKKYSVLLNNEMVNLRVFVCED